MTYIELLKDILNKYKLILEKKLNNNVEFLVERLDNSMKKDESIKVTVHLGNIPVQLGRFKIYPMHGCCGIAISTEAYVNHGYRRNGIGDLLHKMRIDICKKFGYGMIMCTCQSTNVAQIKILEKNNWKNMKNRFINPRTGNTILTYILQL